MCLTPITLKDRITGIVRSVPCGHCLECVKKYQNAWSDRLAAEAECWKSVIFFTLKYDEESISRMDVELDDEQLQFVNENLSHLSINLASHDERRNNPCYQHLLCTKDVCRKRGLLYFMRITCF